MTRWFYKISPIYDTPIKRVLIKVEGEDYIVDDDGKRHYKTPSDLKVNPCFYRATHEEAVAVLREYWQKREVIAMTELELCQAKLAEAKGMA